MPPQPTYNLKKILIVGIILVVIAMIIGFFLIRARNKAATDETSGKNIFPYIQNDLPRKNADSGTIGETPTEDTSSKNPLEVAGADRLRQIANYPVTGFFSWSSQKTVSQPKLDEKTKETVFIPGFVPTNMLRWNAKETGILMDAEIGTDTITEWKKTQTEVPAAEEIWFGNQGNTIAFRSWNNQNREIDTLVGKIPVTEKLWYCNFIFKKDLAKGAKNADVKELQKYLAQKLSITVTADGSYGTKTVLLVKQMQKMLGVAETGIVDVATRDAINADCANQQAEYAKQFEGPAKLTSAFLSGDILRGTASPDGKQIFFLKKAAGGAAGIIANADGTGQRTAFESPITEWMPQWINARTIAMTTLASRETDGYLYFLDPADGSFRKILGPVRGLTTLVSPDAQTILFSQSTDKGINTRTYSQNTGVTQNLDLTTLPAKCVWQDNTSVICGVPQLIPNAQYPDNWYQGLVSFGDVIWSIDTTKKSTQILVSPNQRFDVIKGSMSADKNYFYFINKNDETLWSYRLN